MANEYGQLEFTELTGGSGILGATKPIYMEHTMGKPSSASPSRTTIPKASGTAGLGGRFVLLDDAGKIRKCSKGRHDHCSGISTAVGCRACEHSKCTLERK